MVFLATGSVQGEARTELFQMRRGIGILVAVRGLLVGWLISRWIGKGDSDEAPHDVPFFVLPSCRLPFVLSIRLGTERSAGTRLASDKSGLGRGQPMDGRHESAPKAAFRQRSSQGEQREHGRRSSCRREQDPADSGGEFQPSVATIHLQGRRYDRFPPVLQLCSGSRVSTKSRISARVLALARVPDIPAAAILQITRAYYGLNNRTMDVTRILQSQVRAERSWCQVNNNTMGGDPARGADKVLTVIYRSQRREQTSTVKEGNVLRIP